MFVSSLIGWPVPLLPIQILWVNLVTDGLPALALGVDPVDPGVMSRQPRDPQAPVISRETAITMIMQGAFIAVCSLAAFALVMYVEHESLGRARTAAFTVLSCAQLFHAFNCRSKTESLFRLGIFTNIKLVIAALVSFVLQMVVVYTPFLQIIFKTEPLGLFDWVLVIIISSLPLWAMESVKLYNKGRSQWKT
jgi:Ca2+-transporting ATPase